MAENAYFARISIVSNGGESSVRLYGDKVILSSANCALQKKDLRTMRRPLRFGIKFFYFKNSQKIDFVFFAGFYLPQCFMRVSPIAEGVGDTAMPASSRALILSSAEPEFPETIAPA